MTDKEAQNAVRRAKQFIQTANLGERLVIGDDSGRKLIECEIAFQGKADHVLLITSLPAQILGGRRRFRGLLKNAYDQFMPDALNIIVISSACASDVEELKGALIKEDGKLGEFWKENARPSSQAVIWFSFGLREDEVTFKLISRSTIDPEVQARLSRLFSGTRPRHE